MNQMETNETKIGIIHVAYEQSSTYDLIFTTSRIILTLTCKPGPLLYFLGPIVPFIVLKIRKRKQEELASKSVEDILNSSQNTNFFTFSCIKSIQVKKISGGYNNKLIIITDKGTNEFRLLGEKIARTNKELINKYENIIKSTLPDKMII